MHKVACLFSGGKDSVFAAFWALYNGWGPELVTVFPEPYSMMFHHPNAEWTKLQAEAMGLEQITFRVGREDELEKLKEVLSGMGIKGIIAGAISSEYQKQRIDKIGEELKIPTYSPLWHKEPALAEELKHFQIYITAVSAEGLGPELLGKNFQELKETKNIHPLLEGGEGETFVADAPFFKKRIEVLEWEKEWDGVRGVAHIKEANLVEK
ncbi:diphthine--ammonia ligase [Candidatus Micrarchaeota archaeon]|nr:diphthine--ammonia ligase [Candidatus Micrarchaeota archaeon]MBD3417491.1 diphthine--ammonia ligase [Candidatus Micrarchaeota archaeon]